MNRLALGCAFDLTDMFMNLQVSKLDITTDQCYELIGQYKRRKLAIQIFKECFKLVIKDIIESNVTFWFPLTGSRKCNMRMKRVEGITFQKLKKAGKWRGLDIITSNFSGYEIRLFMLGNRTPREKNVYVSKKCRDQIIQKTNEGFSYGDSNNDVYLKDYLKQIYKLFPDVSKQDIKMILTFGWKSLYLHNSYGGDVLIRDPEFWCYMGKLKKDPIYHYYYYIRKLTVKIRVLYKRKQTQWDGYYYFALTERQYAKFRAQMNKRGRPKKKFHFENLMLYQIYEECSINEADHKFIFRVPMLVCRNLKVFKRDCYLEGVELIEERDPLKFSDIRIFDNKYKCL